MKFKIGDTVVCVCYYCKRFGSINSGEGTIVGFTNPFYQVKWHKGGTSLESKPEDLKLIKTKENHPVTNIFK